MKTPMLALVIAAVACAASSLYLWHELGAARVRAAQVEESSRQLQARIAELEQARARFAQQRMSTAPVFAAGPPGHGAPPPPGSPASPNTAITAASAPGASVEDWQPPSPERSAAFKKVMRAQFRAANKRMYADLGTELGLDKETTSKLIDLLTAQQVDGFDQFTPGADPADSERKLAELQRQNKAAIEDLIGTEKAQSLEEYQQSMPARAEFEMLARQLEANDSPLTPEQGKRLRAVYVEERARIPQPAYEETGGTSDKYVKSMADWEEDYNRRVSDAAAGILNSQQLTTYNDIQQWQKEMRNGIALPAGAAPGRFFVRGGAVPIGAVAGSVTFAAPAPPPKAEDAPKP